MLYVETMCECVWVHTLRHFFNLDVSCSFICCCTFRISSAKSWRNCAQAQGGVNGVGSVELGFSVAGEGALHFTNLLSKRFAKLLCRQRAESTVWGQ